MPDPRPLGEADPVGGLRKYNLCKQMRNPGPMGRRGGPGVSAVLARGGRKPAGGTASSVEMIPMKDPLTRI